MVQIYRIIFCSSKMLFQASNFCQTHWWCCPCLQISTRGHWILAIANCTCKQLQGAKLHTFAANENARRSILWGWMRENKTCLGYLTEIICRFFFSAFVIRKVDMYLYTVIKHEACPHSELLKLLDEWNGQESKSKQEERVCLRLALLYSLQSVEQTLNSW